MCFLVLADFCCRLFILQFTPNRTATTDKFFDATVAGQVSAKSAQWIPQLFSRQATHYLQFVYSTPSFAYRFCSVGRLRRFDSCAGWAEEKAATGQNDRSENYRPLPSVDNRFTAATAAWFGAAFSVLLENFFQFESEIAGKRDSPLVSGSMEGRIMEGLTIKIWNQSFRISSTKASKSFAFKKPIWEIPRKSSSEAIDDDQEVRPTRGITANLHMVKSSQLTSS